MSPKVSMMKCMLLVLFLTSSMLELASAVVGDPMSICGTTFAGSATLPDMTIASGEEKRIVSPNWPDRTYPADTYACSITIKHESGGILRGKVVAVLGETCTKIPSLRILDATAISPADNDLTFDDCPGPRVQYQSNADEITITFANFGANPGNGFLVIVKAE